MYSTEYSLSGKLTFKFIYLIEFCNEENHTLKLKF